MNKTLLTIIMLCIWNMADAQPFTLMPAQNSWWTFDLFHQSRTLPAAERMLERPVNPGYQVRYHHTLLGQGSLKGAGVVQAAYTSFDQLFRAVTVGGGGEAVWKSESGFYASYILAFDYERIFTGNNNFEWINGRYKQKTDRGRSCLRITPVDISVGYAPRILQKAGIIPALRYAWLFDIPLYGGDDSNPWSYTQFGLSINWIIGG